MDPTLDPLSTFHQGMAARTNDAMVAQLQAMQMRMSSNMVLPQLNLSGPIRGAFAGFGMPTTLTDLAFQTVATPIQYDAALRQMRGLTGGRFGAAAEALGGFAVRGSAFGDEAAAADKFSESLRRLGMSRFDALNTMQALAMSARQVTKDMGDAVVKISELSKVAGIDSGTGATLVGNAMRTTGAPLNAQNGQAFFSMMMANAGYSTANLFATQSAVRGIADMRSMRGAVNTMLDPSTGLTAADALYRQFVQFNPQLYGPGGNPEAALRQVGLMAAGGKGAFLGIAMDLMPNKSISQVFAALDRGDMTFPLRNAIARDPALRDLAAMSGLDANFIEGYGVGRRSEPDTRRRLMLIAQGGYSGNLTNDLASTDPAVRRRAQQQLARVRRNEFLVSTTADPYQEQAAAFYQARTGRTNFEEALAADDPEAMRAYTRSVNEKKRRASDPSSLDTQDATSPGIQALKNKEQILESAAPAAVDKLGAFFRDIMGPIARNIEPAGPENGSWNPFSDKPFRLNPFPNPDKGPIDMFFSSEPFSWGAADDDTPGSGGSGSANGGTGGSGGSGASGGSSRRTTSSSGSAPSGPSAPADAKSTRSPYSANPIREYGEIAITGQTINAFRLMPRGAYAALSRGAETPLLSGLMDAAGRPIARQAERVMTREVAKTVTARALWQAARRRLSWWGATKMAARGAVAGAIEGFTGGLGTAVAYGLIATDLVTIGLIINDARKAAQQAGDGGAAEENPDEPTETSQGMSPANAPSPNSSPSRPASPRITDPRSVASGGFPGFLPDSARATQFQLSQRTSAISSRSMREATAALPSTNGPAGAANSAQTSYVAPAPELNFAPVVAAIDRLTNAANDLKDRVDRGDIKVSLEDMGGPNMFGFGMPTGRP